MSIVRGLLVTARKTRRQEELDGFTFDERSAIDGVEEGLVVLKLVAEELLG